MTPGARVAAAIECLDAVAAAAREGGAAADTVVARYFTTRRYAGSKDRRAVRDLVFDVIRSIGDCPATGRGAVIGFARANAPDLLGLFGTDGHAPAALVAGEPESTPGVAPGWLLDKLRGRFGADTPRQAAALLGRAPLDLRVNTLRARRADVVIDGAEPTPFAADGLRLTQPLAVEARPEFHAGLIEIQDEGSQLAVAAAGAAAGMTVVDLCAGAGGKTLALAAAMGNSGRLIATDTDRGRLGRMDPRLQRAGVTIVERRLLDPGHEAAALHDLDGAADLVVIDAPCSGTGTWRRNPEARWRMTPTRLERLVATQARLLEIGAALVRPGGVLLYIVCSLLPDEGDAPVAAFLSQHPEFAAQAFASPVGGPPVTTLVTTPGDHGCDGFTIARLQRL
jgi:16S rRNA (cytosine967-C5)-methyltransferase